MQSCGCDRAKNESQGVQTERPAVRTGAEVLAARDFEELRGRRVGLIANHTTVIENRHLADVLDAHPDVQLTALFGPEHGIRGQSDAGAGVEDTVDAALGVPVYSLYGSRRSPAPEVLAGLDVLVFDIQDVGARFYTYISTMGLSMEAAAEAGVEFVVLDRPNPLGGDYVSGFLREPEFKSFVGYFPIPIAHGMTVGELARMAVGEGWGTGVEDLRLSVVGMEGWSRAMRWPDTGLPWTPTSPNIPEFDVALVYPGACLVEGTIASEGRGTIQPFLTIGAEWLDGARLASSLNALDVPGLAFEAIQFTPRSIPGMSSRPKLLGEQLSGIRYVVSDPQSVRSVEAGISLLELMLQQYIERDEGDGFFRASGFDRLAGTTRLREMLLQGVKADSIVASWNDEVEGFLSRRSAWLLYD
ncbi:MAG: DUF1343 domain-containing protein [Rhodothermia bacterium]|nr:DUF1343 domain-containing protein [Rhodothermia bacterium]